MENMARLKKILLINPNMHQAPEQQQLTPIRTDDLPADLLPVTDEFFIQPGDWDTGLFQSIPAAQARTQELSLPTPQKHTSRLIEALIFLAKHLVFALDACVLATLSYVCLKNQRPYLFLCWYAIAIFWGFLAIPPFRHLLQRGTYSLLQLFTPAQEREAKALSNHDRDVHMRKLQNDTAAYMQALKRLHRTGRH
ncbi:hypothetical protein KDA_23570 [Dictyobacter alpinus]|uniref:Uncharacterized protein n=1 Tax=Dictyobacter alpinus TaxID=2014873 RepID=A0A402B684_9CHLR|nr:hypothetical protein [Dictyobacter alpinus]GCE26873.1 hypothetical protein KDA_23570 [Dictyobacter alpinus]